MPDPLWINASAGAPSYTAAELRRAFSALLAAKGTAGTNRFDAVEGIRPGSGVVASLSGSTITVQEHAGVISPALSSTQGPYVYQLGADETHTLTAAHASLARTDLVTIRIDDDDEDASGLRQAISAYVVGTAGGGVPSLPARSFEIARIAVPASPGAASLTERQRYTVAAGGVLPVRDTADLPAHHEGRAVVQLDTDRLLISDGSAWQRVGHHSVTGRTGCRLYKATSSISTATIQTISWGDEDQDTDGYIAVPGDTVTIPTGLGGLYALTFRTTGAVSGTGHHFVEIDLVSPSTHMPGSLRQPIEPADDAGLVSATLALFAGDTFTCRVYHETGSPVDFESYLSCYRVAI